MVDIVVPSPGESITEVTLGQWHKKDGDWVETDEVLVDIESDMRPSRCARPLRACCASR